MKTNGFRELDLMNRPIYKATVNDIPVKNSYDAKEISLFVEARLKYLFETKQTLYRPDIRYSMEHEPMELPELTLV